MTGFFGRLTAACLLVAVTCVANAGAVAAGPPISVYGKLPALELVALSPSGDRLALIGVVAETRRLVVIDKGGKPLLTIGVGDFKIRDLSWAGEERVLLRYSTTVNLGIEFAADKTELSSMMVIPLNGDKPWTVFDKNDTITGGIRGFYGLAERAGNWFGYFGGITLVGDQKASRYLGSTNAELYEVDLQTGHAKRIATRTGDPNYRDWLIGADGKVAATLDFFSIGGSWKINDPDRKAIASGVNPLGGISLISLGRTPGTILYSLDDEATGESHWFEVPANGGRATEILQDETIQDGYVDPRSRQLIGHVRDGDVREDHFYDQRREKVMAGTRRAFPGLNVRLISWNDAFNRLIVKTDGVGDAGTWWNVDIATGDASELGVSYQMAAQDVGPMHMVRYKTADGLDISGVLTLPPGRQPTNLPVVIFPHGGPSARDYPEFDWWAQALAARGYAVFQPNFRGSTGYGATFQKAGNGEWGRKMQTDISDGLKELVRLGIADPKRACIMGGSYGGYAALAGVTLQQGLYRCAVAVAGVSDVERMYQTDVAESGRDRTLIRALKAEIGSGRALKDVSPIRFADRADAPILLIHGKDDTVVSYDQSSTMARALRGAGKPVEFVTLPGEDHWLSKSATRLAMLEAAIGFIERNNPPDPAR